MSFLTGVDEFYTKSESQEEQYEDRSDTHRRLLSFFFFFFLSFVLPWNRMTRRTKLNMIWSKGKLMKDFGPGY